MPDPSLRIDVVSIFPEMLNGVLTESIIGRAAQSGLVTISNTNLRDFTYDVHRTTDDRPYGGGPGMVMKPEPIFEAVETLRKLGSRIILMSPQGRPFNQALARELSRESHLILISGHYEGVDDRVRQGLVTDEISIGDYVLTNGLLAAAVVIDAVVRLIPGVLGHENSADSESFSTQLQGGLEYPQFTRPVEYRGMKVPDILLSGNHPEIAKWRMEKARQITRSRRPDLPGHTDVF